MTFEGGNSPAPGPRTATTVERTREILEGYWQAHDSAYLAEDAELTLMPTGDVVRGREAIGRYLHHFYHETLDARTEPIHAIFAAGGGVLEAEVVGTHTGEFAGVPATGREVRVPLCVTYELEDDAIRRLRVYLLASVLLQQITAAG